LCLSALPGRLGRAKKESEVDSLRHPHTHTQQDITGVNNCTTGQASLRSMREKERARERESLNARALARARAIHQKREGEKGRKTEKNGFSTYVSSVGLQLSFVSPCMLSSNWY